MADPDQRCPAGVVENPQAGVVTQTTGNRSAASFAAAYGQSMQKAGGYEEQVYRKSFMDSVDRGLGDADGGRTYQTEELREALAARRREIALHVPHLEAMFDKIT